MTDEKNTVGLLDKLRRRVELPERYFPDPTYKLPEDYVPEYLRLQNAESLSKMSDLSQMSGLSGLSASPFFNPAWDQDQQDLFHERAAIHEYDEGMTRSTAEYHARRYLDEICFSQKRESSS